MSTETVKLNFSKNDLIAQMVAESQNDDILNFIADLADYYSAYKHDFREQVIKRMEADR